jgi:hypothetical protein
MTHEQHAALARIMAAGGSMSVAEFDPDLRAGLVRMGFVICTAERTIELTALGKRQLATESKQHGTPPD